ncbi:ferredoxin--NADP reductase, partial [Leptospira borgpetersenii serovar Balcanica]|nr:ferredoxin--NADP reductase [Leptospira borgpetersenii serovar Balcanica]
MTTDSDNIQKVKVLSKTTWTPNLFSFTVTRPDSFKFTAGQFVRLGVNPSRLKYHQDQPNSEAADEDIYRAYSIVSSPYDETLEFFSIVIPDGAFTSQLQHLQVGDELLLNTTPFGFLTLARYQEPLPKDLWLLATGTGLAPFLS